MEIEREVLLRAEEKGEEEEVEEEGRNPDEVRALDPRLVSVLDVMFVRVCADGGEYPDGSGDVLEEADDLRSRSYPCAKDSFADFTFL